MYSKEARKKVLVIGGGPAGMFAAIAASKEGATVTLIEKNRTLGRKLLVTGGGRCNVFNNKSNVRELLDKYSDAKEYLFSPFSQFSVKDSFAYFENNGVALKEEPGGRMFPTTDKSETIKECLEKDMADNHVTVRSNCKVTGLIKDGDVITGVSIEGGEVIKADEFIVATGGLSLPETGSTGDGFKWLSDIGHKIVKPAPVLVPVRTKEEWTFVCSGTGYDNATVKIIVDGKVKTKKSGKVLFTHFGLSGPLILNMSKEISDLMAKFPTQVSIDIYPKMDAGALDRFINTRLKEIQNKNLENSLPIVLGKNLAEAMINHLKLDGKKGTHQLTRDERLKIVSTLKDIRLTPIGLLGADKAIVTSGGVQLNEVDTKSMRSKLFRNLYIVGDMLDINRPSGGFSLQLCWTTGFVAGSAAGSSSEKS